MLQSQCQGVNKYDSFDNVSVEKAGDNEIIRKNESNGLKEVVLSFQSPSSSKVEEKCCKCAICLEISNVKNLYYSHPDGSFEACYECLKSYISSKINSGSVDKNGSMKCPCALNCKVLIQQQEIECVISDDDVLVNKYSVFTLNALVESDPTKCWCPKRGCGAIINLDDSKSRSKCLSCGTKVCNHCKLVHSVLMPCSIVSIFHLFELNLFF